VIKSERGRERERVARGGGAMFAFHAAPMLNYSSSFDLGLLFSLLAFLSRDPPAAASTQPRTAAHIPAFVHALRVCINYKKKISGGLEILNMR